MSEENNIPTKPVLPEAPACAVERPVLSENKPVLPEAPKVVLPEAPVASISDSPKSVLPEAPKVVLPEAPHAASSIAKPSISLPKTSLPKANFSPKPGAGFSSAGIKASASSDDNPSMLSVAVDFVAAAVAVAFAVMIVIGR